MLLASPIRLAGLASLLLLPFLDMIAPSPPAALARLPFESVSNLPFVQLQTARGDTLWFILDTGAQVSIMDAEAARQIGLDPQPVEGVAAGAGEGTMALRIAHDVPLRLGDHPLTLETVYVSPISELLAPHFGQRVDGILGFDVFNRFVITFDPILGEVRLYEPETYRYEGHGTEVALRIENLHPHVEGRIVEDGRDPIVADFIIDTGATGPVYLATPFVNDHGFLTAARPTRPGLVGGIGGLTEQPVGTLGTVQFGPVSHTEPLVYFSQDQSGGFAGLLGADGIIGAEILRRYTSVWDYTRQRLILEPNASLDDPFDHSLLDRSGLSIIADGAGLDTLRVEYVLAHSPADEAGLAVGDHVLKIDGLPDMPTLETIRRHALRTDTLTLRVQRGGDVFTRTIPLAPLPLRP